MANASANRPPHTDADVAFLVDPLVEGQSGPDFETLVADAQDGDHRAFETLVRETYADTYTLAFRLTGNAEDARDVVQETYLRVHRSLIRFRGDAQFSTWLYRITANCASTLLGRRNRHNHDPLPDDASIIDEHPNVDPEHRADVGDLRSQLTEALRSLPPKLRTVVVLRDIYDLPHEAIAEELGITESAAKVRLHRARKRLRERLSRSSATTDAPNEMAVDARVDGVGEAEDRRAM